MIRPTDVNPVHGIHPTTGWIRQLLLGKVALAAYRGRRIPVTTVRAKRLDRADRRAGVTPPRQQYPGASPRAVYVIPVGPGEWELLCETIDSVRVFEGDQAKIVVADDGSHDSRYAVIHEHFPDVDVVRANWPTGGPPRQSHFLARVYQYALSAYDFDVLVKIDTDGLVTGPDLSGRAAEAFQSDPRLGLLGTWGQRADGDPADYSFDRWVLAQERRWSPAVRRVERAARANGFDGDKVQGGVYVLARRALEAADREGWLSWSPPWWTLIPEDLAFSMSVYAAGYRIGSWGAPGEPTASGQSFLPIAKERVLSDGVLAIHSVRRGIDGEDENELRRFFREAREQHAAVSA